MTRLADNEKTATDPLLTFGEFTLDTGQQRLLRGSVAVELPDLSYRLLLVLARAAPQHVSKDDLISEVWDGAVVSDETLAQRVKLLRQSLGDDSKRPRYIVSVRGRGYRMLSPVGFRKRSYKAWWLGAATAAALAFVWSFLQLEPAPSDQIASQSLAVLPFQDMSAGEAQQYFADGMQEELLSRLTRLDGLEIVSRTSVERYRDTALSIREIGSALDADAIIEGSSRVEADRVRITVQLIDAKNDRHIWADSFERELTVSNVFAIQREVADRVAAALSLDRPALSAAIRLPTDSVVAYDAYLLGRYLTFNQSPGDLERAIEHLQNATTIDPGFAEAWAVLGWAWSFQGTTYGSSRPDDVFPRAKDAALKALSLDANLGNAHSLYADILTWYDWDFPAAERSYRRAQELDPLDVLGYALFLSVQGRHEESLDLIERRLEAHPDDLYVQVNAAWRYVTAGRWDDALQAAANADGHPDAEAAAGSAYLRMGEPQRAVDAFTLAIERHGRTPSRVANLATAYFAHGEMDAGGALLEELLGADGYVPPSLPASVLFAAGDADRGFDYLAEAVRQRDRGALFLLTGPVLAEHRDRREFEALAETVGIAGAIASRKR